MNERHKEYAKIFKALSDRNRLSILTMLSGGELCACRILDELRITQPTLSHHMNCLAGCGLVNARRDGKWTHYSINMDAIAEIQTFLNDISCSGVSQKVPSNADAIKRISMPMPEGRS